jgi:hypothetical protein
MLDLCQVDHAADWRRLPGEGPAERLLTGFVDVGDQDGPVLAALQHGYRAVYEPDPTLSLAWGMASMDTRDMRERSAPDWLSAEWTSAESRFAHVLLNGSMVWQVKFAAIDCGAGGDGLLPWPREGTTSEWESRFARLLSQLQDLDREFQSGEAQRAVGFTVVAGHPLHQD